MEENFWDPTDAYGRNLIRDYLITFARDPKILY